MFGVSSVWRWFASDVGYYFAIAYRSRPPFFTFDGENPTTGFHPLWQVLLVPIARAFPNNRDAFIVTVFSLGAALLFASMAAIVLFLATYFGFRGSLFIVFFPGYWLIAGVTLNPNYGHTLSFLNGMESALAFALVTAIVLAFVSALRSPSALKLLGFGAVLSFAALARLEVGVLSGLILITFILAKRLTWYQFLTLITIPVLSAATYLIFNRTVGGNWLPTNAVSKQRVNGALDWNLNDLSRALSGQGDWLEVRLWHHAQVLIPAIICAIFLIAIAVILRLQRSHSFRSLKSFRQWLVADGLLPTIGVVLSLYVVLKAYVIYRSTDIWTQGHWYFFDSIAISNMIVAIALWVPLGPRLTRNPQVVLVFTTISLFFAFPVMKISSTYNEQYVEYWETRSAICEKLESAMGTACEDLRAMEFDDGHGNFGLGIRSQSGFGLAGDPALASAVSGGELEPLIRDRNLGLLFSLNYGKVYTEALECPEAVVINEQLPRIVDVSACFDGS